MNAQTSENRPCDSPISVGLGIDCVSQKWQNTVRVPALFVKTAPFADKDLAVIVKTKLAPPGCNRTRPTRGIGGAHG